MERSSCARKEDRTKKRANKNQALKKQRDEVIEADRKGFEHKDGVGTD